MIPDHIKKIVLLGLERQVSDFQARFILNGLLPSVTEIRLMTEAERDELRAKIATRLRLKLV
jgi:hypothetical protein